MASNPSLITFASREAMAARIADLVEAAAVSGQYSNGRAELALSGGSTPKALYENLARRNLSWSDIGLTLVDERWVSPDHQRSNERFIKEAFAAADGAHVQGLFNGATSPREAVADVAVKLDARPKSFDAVVLGMGNDGHTASWFPHADGLDHALGGDDTICAVTAMQSDITGEETERLTLSLSAIRDARLIILLIAGADKKSVFEKAIDAGPVEDMPVRAILRARPDLWVCWAP